MLKQMPFALVLFVSFSGLAQAQTFTAELQKIDKLRRVFGDQIVNSLTALPPDQYKAARDQALSAADKAGDNVFARESAKKDLCAAFGAIGLVCHDPIEPQPDVGETAPAEQSPVAQTDSSAPAAADSPAEAAPQAEALASTASAAEAQPANDDSRLSAVQKSDEENDAEAASLLAEDPSATPRAATGRATPTRSRHAVASAADYGQSEVDPGESSQAAEESPEGQRHAANEPAVIDDDDKTDPELDQASAAVPQRHVSSLSRVQRPAEPREFYASEEQAPAMAAPRRAAAQPREHYATDPDTGERIDPRDPTL